VTLAQSVDRHGEKGPNSTAQTFQASKHAGYGYDARRDHGRF
jgi:hypothetical protein